MQRSRSVLSCVVCVLLWGGENSLFGVDPVSRKEPRVFRKYLREHLVSLDDVRARQHPFADTAEDGIILLDEVLCRVDSKGRRALALHRVYQPRTEGGVEAVSTVRVPFRKGDQEVSVVLAHSIQPDGTTMAVQKDAAFIQTPQYEADYSLYSDHAEAVIVFPNVKPGTIVEFVAVLEEDAFRIPGEFTAQQVFQAYWPCVLIRAMVELPVDMAERLRITSLGGGLPEPVIEQDGRVTRMTWEKELQREARNEPGRTPLDQIGPVVRLTTLPDWNAFGSWYNSLLAGRNELGRDLRKAVDDWTQGVIAPDEIVQILLDKVANDVRYVGLEFGIGSFQPHACDDVWENQYGDCKDKSNLLCAMLRYKGIDAYLALVNTAHAGLIPRNHPDFRHFTHVIVAIARDGAYVFCDPTVSRLPAGILGPGTTDRDVVLIKPNGANFAHTPDQSCGTTTYEFDLTMSEHGEVSGWMTRRTTGYWAAVSQEFLSTQDRQSTLEAIRYRAEGFFPGCRVVDIEQPQPAEGDDGNDHVLRAYLIVPAAYQGEQETHHLSFPGAQLLPYLEECKGRQTTYQQRKEELRVTVRYTLLAGWSASDTPKPFKIETPPVHYEAGWQVDERACTATFGARYQKAFVPHDEYRLLHNAVSSISAWMTRPLAVKAAAQTATAAEAGPALGDFPVMPSGKGQLTLLNEKFPRGRDVALRREALEQVLQWFPNDRATTFEAQIELSLLADDDAKAAADIREVLRKSTPGELGNETIAWGEYMLASALADTDEIEDARAIFLRLGRDTRLTAFRRGWSCYQAALLMSEDSPKEAIVVLRRAVELDSEALPELVALLAGLLLEHSQLSDLRDVIHDAARQTPGQATAALRSLIDVAVDWLYDGRTTEFETILGTVRTVIDDPRLQHLKEDVEEAVALREELLTYVRLRGMIQEFLRDKTPDWFKPETVKVDRDDLEAIFDAIDGNLNSGQLQVSLVCALDYLSRFEPDPDTAGYALWTAARIARVLYGKTDLPGEVLSWCEQLPESDPYRHECAYVRGQWLRDNGKIDEAAAIYEQYLGEEAKPVWRVASCFFLGQIREEQGKFREALALYRTAEALRESNTNGVACMLRAVFINLGLGDRDEAVRLVLALDRLDDEKLAACGSPVQVRELAALVRDRTVAEEYWNVQDTWRPQWEALEKRHELDPLPGGICVPIIPDLHVFGAQVGLSLATNDARGTLTKMRPLFYAARWQPTMALEAAAMHIFFRKSGDELVADIRALAGTMLVGFRGQDSETEERRLLLLAIQRTADGKQQECYDVASGYLAERKIEDERDVQVLRMYAACAMGLRKPLGNAITKLEKVLADNVHDATRAATVQTLSGLYVAEKRRPDAVALLQRELESPAVKGDAVFTSLLKSQLDNLTRETDQSDAFSQAVKRWLESYRPDWFGFAEPTTMDDPRVAKLSLFTPEEIAAAGLLPPEACKAALLVALAPDQPLSRKERAFRHAYSYLLDLCRRRDSYQNIVDAVIADRDFGHGERQHALLLAVFQARSVAGEETLKRYEGTEMYKATSPLIHQMLERAVTSGKQLGGTAEETRTFLLDSLQVPPEHFTAITLREGLHRLVALGDLEGAQRVFNAFRDGSWEPGNGNSKIELQLELLRLLRHARETVPAHLAMREKLLAAYPNVGVDRALADAWLSATELPLLDQESAFQVRVAKIRHHDVVPASPPVWAAVIGHVSHFKDNPALGQELIRTAIEKVESDRIRAFFLNALHDAFDVDDPREREEMLALARSCQDQEKFPATTDSARFVEARLALRSGDAADPHSLLSAIKSPFLRELGTATELQHYLARDDAGGLERALGKMSAAEMIESSDPRTVLAALDRLARKDEAQLVRDALERQLYEAVLGSWCDLGRCGRVPSLAEALGGEPAYPAAWTRSILTRMKDEWTRSYVATYDAWLRRDWDSLLSHAEAFLKKHPKFYDRYWYKGQALYHLGRKKEAAEALSVFVRYSHDSIDRPRAMKLLDELR